MEKSHFLAFEFQTDFCTLKAEAVVLESVSECLSFFLFGEYMTNNNAGVRTIRRFGAGEQKWLGHHFQEMTWGGDKTPGSDEAQERAEYHGGGEWPR